MHMFCIPKNAFFAFRIQGEPQLVDGDVMSPQLNSRSQWVHLNDSEAHMFGHWVRLTQRRHWWCFLSLFSYFSFLCLNCFKVTASVSVVRILCTPVSVGLIWMWCFCNLTFTVRLTFECKLTQSKIVVSNWCAVISVGSWMLVILATAMLCQWMKNCMLLKLENFSISSALLDIRGMSCLILGPFLLATHHWLQEYCWSIEKNSASIEKTTCNVHSST